MRSFFKKPAWATTDDEPSAPEFYRRSQQTFDDIVKARRQQQEEAKKSALNSLTETKIPTSKRRRVSEPDDDRSKEEASATNNDELESPLPSTEKREETTSSEVADRHVLSELVDSNTSDSGLHALDEQTISPEFQVMESIQSPKDNSPLSIFPTNESDKARRASKNRRSTSKDSSANITKERSQSAGQLHTENGDLPTARDENVRSDHDVERNAAKQEDATVEILITSAIENTRPLVVYRRMSQRFRDVRLAWCERQGFDEKMTSSVYLTWNKRRLFDVTTCRSLDYSALASLSSSLDLEYEAFSPNSLFRVHVEAVTDELLKSQARQLSQNTAADEDEFEEQQVTSFHVVLKSQDRGDLRVKVLPQTTVSQLITNFRNKKKISQGSTVSLSFDGDLLSPSSQLKDYDIADLDLVDVLVR